MNRQQLEESAKETSDYYTKSFIKHYFNKNSSELTKENINEMNSFGLWGMTEWVIDNVKQ